MPSRQYTVRITSHEHRSARMLLQQNAYLVWQLKRVGIVKTPPQHLYGSPARKYRTYYLFFFFCYYISIIIRVFLPTGLPHPTGPVANQQTASPTSRPHGAAVDRVCSAYVIPTYTFIRAVCNNNDYVSRALLHAGLCSKSAAYHVTPSTAGFRARPPCRRRDAFRRNILYENNNNHYYYVLTILLPTSVAIRNCKTTLVPR